MKKYTLFYYEDNLLTERDFVSLKSCRQYQRRKKITNNFRLFYDGVFIIPFTATKTGFITLTECIELFNKFNKPFEAPEPSIYKN